MARSRILHLVLAASLALLASGCGSRGDGGPSDVRPKAAAGEPVIATLGDSITAGSPLWDPDEDVRDSFERSDQRSQWQRWVATDAQLRNCGVWGERTDEIAARYAECTDGADAIVIQGGINDIVQGRPVDDAAQDLACIAERARRDGLRIALVEVLPWNRGHPDAEDEIDALNRRIRALARRGGVPVLPFHAVLEDAGAPGRMPDALTDDGNHPNVAGYRRLGEDAWLVPKRAERAFDSTCEDGGDG